MSRRPKTATINLSRNLDLELSMSLAAIYTDYLECISSPDRRIRTRQKTSKMVILRLANYKMEVKVVGVVTLT